MKKGNDSKTHISWCLKQKRGISLEDENNSLCAVYVKKTKSSLNMLDSALEKNEFDWISTTAYYARYFICYALLQKIGIKSEIHDCTISLIDVLFVQNNLLTKNIYEELVLAKDLMAQMQYYVTETFDVEKLKSDCQKAKLFVLEVEEYIESVSSNDADSVRNKVKEMMG